MEYSALSSLILTTQIPTGIYRHTDKYLPENRKMLTNKTALVVGERHFCQIARLFGLFTGRPQDFQAARPRGIAEKQNIFSQLY